MTACAALGALLLTTTAISGCGGHHSSSSASNTTLTAIINWPERSRATMNPAPAAAVAAIITAESGDPNTGDAVDFTPIKRPTPAPGQPATAAVQTMWTSPSAIRQGSTKFQIRFYSELPTATGSTDNSLTASAYAKLPSAGDAAFTVNVTGAFTDLGTFSVVGTIASINVPSETVNFGNITSLIATGYDATGTGIIPLPPGATFYAAAATTPISVDAGGNATGTGLGPTIVTATLSGAASTSGTVTTTTTVTAIVGSSELTPSTPDGSTVQVRDTVAGTGAALANGQTVSLTYTGYFTTDPANNVDSGKYTAFDTAHATTSQTVILGNGTLPPGLNEAVVGMLRGGTRIAVIPANKTAGLGIPATAPSGAPGIYVIQAGM